MERLQYFNLQISINRLGVVTSSLRRSLCGYVFYWIHWNVFQVQRIIYERLRYRCRYADGHKTQTDICLDRHFLIHDNKLKSYSSYLCRCIIALVEDSLKIILMSLQIFYFMALLYNNPTDFQFIIITLVLLAWNTTELGLGDKSVVL